MNMSGVRAGIALFLFAFSGSAASLFTATSVDCRITTPDGASTSGDNPCSLWGTEVVGPWSNPPYAWAEATATAQYGFLKANVNGAAAFSGYATGTALAVFTDRVRIYGPRIAGIEIEISVLRCGGYWAGFGTSCTQASELTATVGTQVTNILIDTPTYWPPLTPTTIRVTTSGSNDFDLLGRLNTYGEVSYQDDNIGSGGDTSARITAIRLVDTRGEKLRNYHYRTESGASYPFVGGSLLSGTLGEVPEPGTALLIGLGALSVWLSRKVLVRHGH